MIQKLFFFTVLVISSLNLFSQTKPIANNDSFFFYRNSFAFFPVLKNDYDKDSNDKITLFDIITKPKHGTAILDIPRDYLKYTSDSTYIGFDSLEYSIIDKSGLKDTAKVYFNINYQLIVYTNEASKISIYPNPAKERLFVLNISNQTSINYILTDFYGRKIQKGKIDNKEKEISLKELTNGVYILVIENEQGNILLKQKVIKE
jgi:hypothetical protein